MLCVAAAGTAQAWNTNSNYNTTVGKFNGNGYSGYDQRKLVTDKAGFVHSNYVGGNYKVDGRIDNFFSSWARLDNGTNASLPNIIHHGNWVRMQFSNDAWTPVAVQVSGYWRSH